ncbi:hypothetical protein KC360_g7845 [Hortaea werneckii]|nr:hypothetical protein KC325_g7856 [Hortaea werneckii]KAI6987679.1 hypothetical protein KC359_g8153 [Hortaea werneckii]KAI7141689.1 hypothetical protein KC344_g7797 [Hortaea werneckii]KAI7168787.1 hypothetical protein KC360_g7845 [Hortaea werneckii]
MSALSMSQGTEEVDRLLLDLERNLENAKISLKPEQESLLERVKVLGRNPSTATPIFSKKGISTLSQYALGRDTSNASREALRTLANAFLLNEASRQTFVDLGYAPKAADRLKVDDRDEEFVISRILFLLTYNTNLQFDYLVEHHDLADSINRHVEHHGKTYSRTGRRKSATSPMEEMSMIETSKLIFNIMAHYPDLRTRFTPSIEPLLNLILYHPLPSPPLQPPISTILNALMGMDFQSAEHEAESNPLFPSGNPEEVIDCLVSIFDNALRNTPEKDLDLAAMPLCTLIRRAYQFANGQMKSWMRGLLLPREQDRDQPLGKGETLSARLLRATCAPHLPTLGKNVSGLLFELSDQDANKFVQNIGYGFASGFLASEGIPVPSSTTEASSESQNGNAGARVDINPVTGQRLDAEDNGPSPSAEMTEEEKEREAERLFVLFERLKATGVVDIQNPVQQAKDEGRFEELPD